MGEKDVVHDHFQNWSRNQFTMHGTAFGQDLEAYDRGPPTIVADTEVMKDSRGSGRYQIL